jgi:hypothetical protein
MARREHAFRAEIVDKSAYLNSEFGIDLAQKKLGLSEQEIVEIVGRYSRGKRKGQIRGRLAWFKVDAGGWINGLGVVPPCSWGYHLVDTYADNIIFPTGLNDFPGSKLAIHLYLEEREEGRITSWQKYLTEQQYAVQNSDIFYKYSSMYIPSEEHFLELKKEDIAKTKYALLADYNVLFSTLWLYCMDSNLDYIKLGLREVHQKNFPFVLSVNESNENEAILCLKPLIDRCRDRLIEFILDKELGIDPGLFNAENSRRYNELQQKKQKKQKKRTNNFFDYLSDLVDSLEIN